MHRDIVIFANFNQVLMIYILASRETDDRHLALQGRPCESSRHHLLSKSTHESRQIIFWTWLRILSRVQRSILWLLRFPATGEANLLQTATTWAGPEVASRIRFTDVAHKEVHIARCCVADLVLDTAEVSPDSPFRCSDSNSDLPRRGQTQCSAHTIAAEYVSCL